jgi:hypothetical protein
MCAEPSRSSAISFIIFLYRSPLPTARAFVGMGFDRSRCSCACACKGLEDPAKEKPETCQIA